MYNRKHENKLNSLFSNLLFLLTVLYLFNIVLFQKIISILSKIFNTVF